jgi:hypothetical protein
MRKIGPSPVVGSLNSQPLWFVGLPLMRQYAAGSVAVWTCGFPATL